MSENYYKKIRNFAIIAHIDHGKSTLADRMLDITGTVSKREMKDRVLDTLELEQERGITIKLQTARMSFKYSGEKAEFKSEEPYILNLIDTPGHVDFSYEVSRSIAASEAAILLVDATQGIQAQTLTTVYKALEYNLEIIPVINKVDLPSAQVKETIEELFHTFGFNEDEILLASGKSGLGVEGILNRIIEKCPTPDTSPYINGGFVGNEVAPRMLIYDSFYHEHKGVVVLVKVVEGSIKNSDKLYSLSTNNEIEVLELGYLRPDMVAQKELKAGEVGYIATGLKDIKTVHVGETLTNVTFKKNPPSVVPGYQSPKPMVYATLFPVNSDDFPEFSEAVEKLALNDAALTYKKEHSVALGSGYVCGFLGLLHLEITQERLEKEFDIDLISTSPTVDYKVWLTTTDYSKLPTINIANQNSDGSFGIRSAAEFPDPTFVEKVEEPWVRLEILTPDEYIGALMELCTKHRGIYKHMEYISGETGIQGRKHVNILFEIPTAEIITNFFDTLKSISQGYASMDYNFIEYRQSDVVKVEILINHEPAPALSFLSHKSNAESRGRAIVSKLKEFIPKQQFNIALQASIGSKIIARETIQQYRKDVIAGLYGGDRSRKNKLLDKQKRGKKRMKQFGKIEVPKEAFLSVLKID